ncbi:MAG: hypothetical protein JSV63_00950, partial [Candidatus Aenigmatarchaeota archaeon]
MIIPFRPKKRVKDRIKDLLFKFSDNLTIKVRKLPTRRYLSFYVSQKSGKFIRRSRYLAEDAGFELKKLSRHTELILFSLIILFSLFILFGYEGRDMLTTLIAILLIVLIVVIYAQMRIQKRMIKQYMPAIDFVRVTKSQLYSDRIRMINIYGVRDRLDEIGKIRNVVIGYDVVNESYSPVSIEGAALTIKLKKGRRIQFPTSASILDVQPKKSSGTEVSFRLKNPVRFDSIEWLQLELRGNVSKKVRIKPHLYVNIMLR